MKKRFVFHKFLIKFGFLNNNSFSINLLILLSLVLVRSYQQLRNLNSFNFNKRIKLLRFIQYKIEYIKVLVWICVFFLSTKKKNIKIETTFEKSV